MLFDLRLIDGDSVLVPMAPNPVLPAHDGESLQPLEGEWFCCHRDARSGALTGLVSADLALELTLDRLGRLRRASHVVDDTTTTFSWSGQGMSRVCLIRIEVDGEWAKTLLADAIRWELLEVEQPF